MADVVVIVIGNVLEVRNVMLMADVVMMAVVTVQTFLLALRLIPTRN
jgi:hypothetical protein